MVPSSTPRAAYLQHLEQKRSGTLAPPPIRAHSKHSSRRPLNNGSSNSSNNNNIPVWKQRQLRNLEQTQSNNQNQQDFGDVSFQPSFPPPSPPPAPPPPPPLSDTIEGAKQENPIFSSPPAKNHKPLFAPVSPETPFATTPASLRSSQKEVQLEENESEADYDDTREPPHSPLHSQQSNSISNNKRFAFFQATSPKASSKKTLSDKINRLSASARTKKSSVDPSADGTHTTFVSDDDETTEQGDEDITTTTASTTPTPPKSTKSLTAAWQESLLQHDSSSLALPSTPQKIPLPPLHLDEEENDETETAQESGEVEEALATQKPSSIIQEDEASSSTVTTSTTTPLKVIDRGIDNHGVTARWQARIRQKHGRNNSTSRIPMNPTSNMPSSVSSPNKPKPTKRSFPVDDTSPLTATTFDTTAAPSMSSDDASDVYMIQTTSTSPTTTPPVRRRQSFSLLQHYSPSRSPTTETEGGRDLVVATTPSERSMVPFQASFHDDREPMVDAMGNNAAIVAMDDDVEFNTMHQELVPEDENALVIHVDHPFEMLMELIHDAEERWEDSAKLTSLVRPSPLAYLSMAQDESEQAKLIRLQQDEIAELRAQLTETQIQQQHPSAMSSPSTPTARLSLPANTAQGSPFSSPADRSSILSSPVEFIDSVPFEHIEVNCVDDPDVASVTSGLTNLNDLMFHRGGGGFGTEDSAVNLSSSIADPFGSFHEPPKSPADRLASSGTKIVRRVPVALQAADGSSRNALYTGPVVEGQYSGFGYFQFEKTGDVYKGEVLAGRMHGQGTYTYARRSKRHKNKPAKVLRGTFENNVFTGWDPSTITWQQGTPTK